MLTHFHPLQTVQRMSVRIMVSTIGDGPLMIYGTRCHLCWASIEMQCARYYFDQRLSDKKICSWNPDHTPRWLMVDPLLVIVCEWKCLSKVVNFKQPLENLDLLIIMMVIRLIHVLHNCPLFLAEIRVTSPFKISALLNFYHFKVMLTSRIYNY